MKYFALIIGLMANASAWADTINVEWKCSNVSQSVSVFFDKGQLKFNPDPFSGSMSFKSGVNYTSCIADFQRRIDAAVTKFKQENCPASKDAFCFASNDYTNGKVAHKIKYSPFVSQHSSIQVTAITPGAAAIVSGVASSAQSYLEEQITQGKVDPKNLNQTFVYGGKTHKVSDFDSVIGENIENIFVDMSRDEAKQFTQNYMTAKSEHLNSNHNPSKRKEVLDNLNRMFVYVYGDKAPEELAKIMECEPEDNLAPISDILERLADSKKQSECKPLNPGEHKIFSNKNSDPYATGDYLLRRKPDGNYQAILNVEFRNGASSMSPAVMMERAKSCMNMASPYMKGPDGKFIQVSVQSPSEINELPSNQRPTKNVINIQGPKFQNNSGNYAQDIDCATIAHEMLHLLGLCDEYLEDRPQYGSMWNCRVVTSAPSLMRETTRTFGMAVPQAKECLCSGATCNNVMASGNEDLKKLYVSSHLNHISTYKVRTDFCQEGKFATLNSGTNPGKSISILSDKGSRFSYEWRAVGQNDKPPYYSVTSKVITCDCKNDSKCLEEKETILREASNPSITTGCPNFSVFSRDIPSESPQSVLQPGKFTLVSKPRLPSLLQPNQFKKILAGNCPGIVDGYLECASFAYKGHPQKVCNVPARCKNDSYYLGTEQ